MVAATLYLFATKHTAKPLQQSAWQPTASSRVETVASTSEQPSPATPDADESVPAAPESNEERAAAVKHAIEIVMAPSSHYMVDWLVSRGLALTEAEQIAQRYMEGFADCLFEATRMEYEARGMSFDDFLKGAEMAWSQTIASVSTKQVRSRAAPCVANVSQQTGVPLPANFESSGIANEPIPTPRMPPPWAADMQARIRDYVASHSELAITDVLVGCMEDGCNVLVVGRDIPAFELNFDVFAEQNGFRSAAIFGDEHARQVRLQR